MDTTTVVLLILGAIAAYLVSNWSPGSGESPVDRETREATVEKCPHCKSLVGISARDSATWRMSKKAHGKDVCPHCGKRIKR